MFTKEIYEQRRMKLMSLMGEKSIALIPTGQSVDRTLGIEYPFRAKSDAIYLGFDWANAVIVLCNGKSILFCEEKNDAGMIWTGEVPGLEGAVNDFGFNEAYSIETLHKKMLEFLEGQSHVFVPYADKELVARAFGWIEAIDTSPKPHHTSFKPDVSDVCKLIARMRLVKGAEEIEVMRRVAKISADAHREIIRSYRVGTSTMEWHVETKFHKYTRDRGCSPLPAYPTIVASGKNACTLHYTDNNCQINGGSVLIDAGAEYDYYAADITRVFPSSGKFSEEEKALYELVLLAQMTAIAEVCAGNPWNVLQDTADRIITEGLIKLGLPVEMSEKRPCKRFFMHRIGHWIGLDVHDVGDYKDENGDWVILEPGMVLTIEPGLYIQPDDESVEEKWRGIGIRIEDDILVTETGHEVLSRFAPKTIVEIENLMKK